MLLGQKLMNILISR